MIGYAVCSYHRIRYLCRHSCVILRVLFYGCFREKRYKLQHLLHLMLWFTAAFVLGISYAGTAIYWMIYLVTSIFLAFILYAVSYARGKETVSLTVMDLLKMKSPQADV